MRGGLKSREYSMQEERGGELLHPFMQTKHIQLGERQMQRQGQSSLPG